MATGRILGPGSTYAAAPFSTERLIADAYATATKLAVIRTKQEARQRGFDLSDKDAYELVSRRLASGESESSVLGPVYDRALTTAARMEPADGDTRTRVYGNVTMSPDTAAVATNPNQESNR